MRRGIGSGGSWRWRPLWPLRRRLALLAGSVYVTSRWSAIEKLGVILVWAAALATYMGLARGGAVEWAAASARRTSRSGGNRDGGVADALRVDRAGELSGVVAAAVTGALFPAAGVL